jgi:hypothetical protein
MLNYHWLAHLAAAAVLWVVVSVNSGLRDDVAAARAEVSTLKIAAKASSRAVVQRETLRVARAPERAAGAAAAVSVAASEPEWANAPLPQEVRDALAD